MLVEHINSSFLLRIHSRPHSCSALSSEKALVPQIERIPLLNKIFSIFLPESQSEYFSKLKTLIEDTYSANGNKKITLLSHSLGCPYTLVFLNKQTQDWKDRYILQWITLSGKKKNKSDLSFERVCIGCLYWFCSTKFRKFLVTFLPIRWKTETRAQELSLFILCHSFIRHAHAKVRKASYYLQTMFSSFFLLRSVGRDCRAN